MDTEIQNIETGLQKKLFKIFRPTPKNILAASLIGFILIMILITVCLSNQILKQKNIYKGIYINNIYVGNMSANQAKNILVKKFQNNIGKRMIEFKCKGESENFKLSDIGTTFKISDAVNKAYSIGRTGNVFSRLYNIIKLNFNEKSISIGVDYDKQKVDALVNSLYDRTLISVSGPRMFFSDKEVKIRSGHHGENLDKSFALKKINSLIENCKGKSFTVPVLKAPMQEIDFEEIYKQINIDVKDASLKVEHNKVTISPEVIGRTIDKSQLENIVSDLSKKEDTDVELPVNYVYPKVTVESLNRSLFKDTLNTYWTQYNQNTQNNRNRVVNIKLAISKINNLILGPGQVFSFNDVVGDRTASLGYLEAITYSNGKLVKGVGGGLCQVATTLYNAVLRSDLQVMSRVNHSFIVAYVPLGMDATVSYGSVDFKFKNSSKWPIRINCWTTRDNKLYFSLMGTNENPKKSVEFSSKIVKSIPYKTVYIDDPTLPMGKINPVPQQEGHTGYIVDTYRITKQDGKVIDSSKMYTSTYRTLDEQLLRGTKKAAVVQKTPPAKVQKATPAATPSTVKGVDDADNPPAGEKPAEPANPAVQ